MLKNTLRITFAAALLLSPATAFAAFTQATCTTGSPDAAVPLALGSTGYDRDPSYLVPSSISSNYQNLLNYETHIYLNSNVQGVTLTTGGFDVENSFDFVKIKTGGGVMQSFTGPISAKTFPEWTPTGCGALGDSCLVQYFTSDYSVTRANATYFNSLAPRCKATVSPTANVGQIMGDTTHGVLIKTGDVLYFTFIQSNVTLVSLNALATTSGADFDLYVSASNPTPDDSSFDFRGYSGNASEALLIPYPGSQRSMYVGVHAYRGAGHFSVRADTQTTGRKTIKVCTPGDNVASSPNLSGFIQTLQAVSLRAAVATTGSDFTVGFDVYPTPACASGQFCNCDSTCKVCTTQASASDKCGFQTVVGGAARIPNIACSGYSNAFALSEPLVHEIFGHGIYAFVDERGAAPLNDPCQASGTCQDFYPTCGHSLMGVQWISHSFCDVHPFLHCKDGDSSSAPATCATTDSNWSKLISMGIPKRVVNELTNTTDPTLTLVNNPNAQSAISVVIH